MRLKPVTLVLVTLRWATALLFLGKFLQCAWSICPVVEFLGYESVMRNLISPDMPWEEYAVQVYPWLSEYAAWFWTIVYAGSTGVMMLSDRWHKWIIPGIVLIVLDAFMASAGHYFWLISILEKTLMWATPICYLSVCYRPDNRQWMQLARYAIALVFLVHGLLAVGIIPQPGYWAEMLSQSTGLSNANSVFCLQMIGFLDILAAVVLVWQLPGSGYVWYYLIVWGLLTALGRIIGYAGSSGIVDLIMNWSYEALIRLPHGLTPLALFFAVRDQD